MLRERVSRDRDHGASPGGRTRQRGRRDELECSRRATAGSGVQSARHVSPSAAELISCGYRESMLSVLSSSFSSGSIGSILSHASSSASSHSAVTHSHHQHHQHHQRHHYHRQPSPSSSSSAAAWRNSFAGRFLLYDIIYDDAIFIQLYFTTVHVTICTCGGRKQRK